MEKLDISKEEELQILEEGIKSRFWAVYSAWLSQSSFTSIGAALSAKVEAREWEAGHASGLKKALSRPNDRIRELRRYITEQAKHKP
jgi:hypothetical protein